MTVKIKLSLLFCGIFSPPNADSLFHGVISDLLQISLYAGITSIARLKSQKTDAVPNFRLNSTRRYFTTICTKIINFSTLVIIPNFYELSSTIFVHNKHSPHVYDNNAYPVIPVEPAVPADSASLFWPPSSQLLPIQPHYVQHLLHSCPM